MFDQMSREDKEVVAEDSRTMRSLSFVARCLENSVKKFLFYFFDRNFNYFKR